MEKVCKWVGRLYSDVFHLLAEDERGKLSRLMYERGLSDADEVVRALKIERDLHGCATALMAMIAFSGLKASLRRKTKTK